MIEGIDFIRIPKLLKPKKITYNFDELETIEFISKGKKIEISVKDFLKAIKKLGGKDND